MNSDFIQAVKRMVERGTPRKLHCANPGPARMVAGPPMRPQAVQEVSIQRQLSEAAWSVSWQAVPGAVGYELQTNPDPMRLMRWFARGRVAETNAQVKLNTIGNRLWLRVRALSLAGVGPWSDPILLRRAEAARADAA